MRLVPIMFQVPRMCITSMGTVHYQVLYILLTVHCTTHYCITAATQCCIDFVLRLSQMEHKNKNRKNEAILLECYKIKNNKCVSFAQDMKVCIQRNKNKKETVQRLRRQQQCCLLYCTLCCVVQKTLTFYITLLHLRYTPHCCYSQQITFYLVAQKTMGGGCTTVLFFRVISSQYFRLLPHILF